MKCRNPRLSVITALLVFSISACSDYLPMASGALEGTVSPLPEIWNELADTSIIQLETTGEQPYSVNLWIASVSGLPHVFAGDNHTEWVRNIGSNNAVRLKVGERIYELKATRVESLEHFEAFAKAWDAKYGNRPRNDSVSETYLFKLEPRD